MRHVLALTTIAFLASGCGAPADPGDGLVPAEQNALFEFLKAREYATFASEPAAHPSTGPHSGDVRVFLDPVLEASLKAGNTTHPQWAAAVKELDVQNGEPGGWAVLVKTSDDSQGGNGFYWYEIFSTTDGSDPPYAGQGLGICVNCHSGGVDFHLSAYPLE